MVGDESRGGGLQLKNNFTTLRGLHFAHCGEVSLNLPFGHFNDLGVLRSVGAHAVAISFADSWRSLAVPALFRKSVGSTSVDITTTLKFLM